MLKLPALTSDQFVLERSIARCQRQVGCVKAGHIGDQEANDLLDATDRQEVPKSIALRVINYRLKSTFPALEK